MKKKRLILFPILILCVGLIVLGSLEWKTHIRTVRNTFLRKQLTLTHRTAQSFQDRLSFCSEQLNTIGIEWDHVQRSAPLLRMRSDDDFAKNLRKCAVVELTEQNEPKTSILSGGETVRQEVSAIVETYPELCRGEDIALTPCVKTPSGDRGTWVSYMIHRNTDASSRYIIALFACDTFVESLLDGLLSTPESHYWVVDSQGRIYFELDRHDNQSKPTWPKTLLPDLVSWSYEESIHGISQKHTSDHEIIVMTTFSPLRIGNQNLRLISATPERAVIGALTVSMKRQLLFGASVTLLLLLMVFWYLTTSKRAALQEVERRVAHMLEESERKYQHLVENSKDIIFKLDAQNRFAFISKSIEEITGYSPDEMIGKSIQSFVSTELLSPAQRKFQEILEKGEKQDFLLSITSAQGKEIWLEVVASPVKENGKVHEVMGIARDVTERIETERTIRELDTDRKTIIDTMPSICIVLTPDYSIDFINKVTEHITGYVPEELQGKNIFDTLFAGADGNITRIRSGMCSREIRHIEINLLTRDGSPRLLLWSSTPMCSENGELKSIVAMAIDITEKKKLEQQLLQSQKMESLGTLAGGITHDFNNLLGGIMGYASILETHLPLGSREHKDVQVILRTAQRAANLTSRLLSFVRGGKHTFEAVDLNAVIEEVAVLLSRTIDKIVKIETHLEKNLCRVLADENQMEQCLMNILINARDAMPKGGTIKVETQNVIMDQQSCREFPHCTPGNYILISVADTGVGMDEEVRQKIFDPFFTTKEKREGTGLGLAMVYGIIKSHGGNIYVNSERNKGTSFTVLLPVCEEEIVGTETKEIKEPVEGGNEHILLVDDEEVVREFLAIALNKAGYSVTLAANSKKGLELFKKEGHFDLVVLDMIMPDMPGDILLEHLRKIDPEIRVLIVSGYAETSYNQELFQHHTTFLKKPFIYETFLTMVRKSLDARSTSVSLKQ